MARKRPRVRFPPDPRWAGMYQGGELHLQCGCGGFDSRSVHHAVGLKPWGKDPRLAERYELLPVK